MVQILTLRVVIELESHTVYRTNQRQGIIQKIWKGLILYIFTGNEFLFNRFSDVEPSPIGNFQK